MSAPTVSTRLAQIAEQSKREPARVFTTLAQHMDEDFLTEGLHQLRKDAAAGIDQMTVAGWCGGRRSARCRNRGSSMSFECGQQRVMRLGRERLRSLALRRVLTNRMREYFTYGSVGGAGGNPGSYPAPNRHLRLCVLTASISTQRRKEAGRFEPGGEGGG